MRFELNHNWTLGTEPWEAQVTGHVINHRAEKGIRHVFSFSTNPAVGVLNEFQDWTLSSHQPRILEILRWRAIHPSKTLFDTKKKTLRDFFATWQWKQAVNTTLTYSHFRLIWWTCFCKQWPIHTSRRYRATFGVLSLATWQMQNQYSPSF